MRSVGEERTGLGLHHEVLDLPEAELAERFALSPSGGLLVRPDGFVVWRAETYPDDAAVALRDACSTRVPTASG